MRRDIRSHRRRLASSVSENIVACLTKKVFDTEDEAIIFCKEGKYNNRPYFCMYCEKWHLTSDLKGLIHTS